MPRLPVVKIGHPVLRKKCAAIDPAHLENPALKKLLKDMVVTMYKEKGVGLAANQVAYDLQAIVLECKSNARYPDADRFPLETYLNPVIMEYSQEKETDWEGCLSIPGYRGLVPRSKKIIFEAITPEGQKVRKTLEGFHARVMQHEVDHINGFFYMDRMDGLTAWMHLDEFNRLLESHVSDK